jgi:NADH-quinone oxidoreductase subunit L
MLLGCLALGGIPPLSGFWSKDEILAVTFEVGGENRIFLLLYGLGIATAFMTAFYTFRLWFMTFGRTFRGHHEDHIHESPGVMTAPLAILAVFAAASGLLLLLLLNGTWSNFVFYGEAHTSDPFGAFAPTVEGALLALSVAVAVGGVVLAYALYARPSTLPERVVRSGAGARLQRLLLNRYYIDRAVDNLAMHGVAGVARGLDWFDRRAIDGAVNGAARGTMHLAAASDWFDRKVIDGTVNALSLSTVRSSLSLRQRATGRVQNYAAVVVFGLSAVILAVLIVRFILLR